jgi:aerobic-type carbon monoxide dehydrogenase small subunit (CoxS/CutS family)
MSTFTEIRTIQLNVNGAAHRVRTESDRSLLSVLRDDLDLTGSKYGCGEGQCGACTVLLDGEPTRSCITAVGTVAGRRITTIEGLERDGRLHPLQQAFIDLEAMQCAYCTSGMIVSGAALLAGKTEPNVDEILRFMEGNVCRCGTYPRIVAAIQRAAQTMKAEKAGGQNGSGSVRKSKGGAR